jgi:hypothetical protein
MSHLTDDALELTAEAMTDEQRAHLGGCAECTTKVHDAHARARLLRGLTPYTLSDMAFRRVEARLMAEVEQGLPAAEATGWWRSWWLAPLAAGLIAVAWAAARAPQSPLPVQFAVGPAQAPRSAHVEPLTVLRASGDARGRHDTQAWKPLSAGDVVAAGDAVFGSSVRLATGNDVRWAFELSGAASLGGASTLSLGAGELKASIDGLEADVLVGSLDVVATQGVFSVNRAAAETVVDVSSGSVELRESSSATRRTVTAPARLRLADGSPLGSAQVLPEQAVGLTATPPRPWVRFDTSSLPAGTQISLDGAALGDSPFAMLVGAGRHRLGLGAAGKPVRESWVELTGERYVPTLSVEPRAPSEAPPPDDAAIARVQDELVRNRPKLAACYEKWLKANPSATADVELHLVVNAAGRVKSASVDGANMSGSSAECLARTAKGLQLPGVGSEVEFALPLHLTTRP